MPRDPNITIETEDDPRVGVYAEEGGIARFPKAHIVGKGIPEKTQVTVHSLTAPFFYVSRASTPTLNVTLAWLPQPVVEEVAVPEGVEDVSQTIVVADPVPSIEEAVKSFGGRGLRQARHEEAAPAPTEE